MTLLLGVDLSRCFGTCPRLGSLFFGLAVRGDGPHSQPEKQGGIFILVRLPRAAFRSCEHERGALGYYRCALPGLL